MADWYEFAESTQSTNGVEINVLEKEFDREQKQYYMLSIWWSTLATKKVLTKPKMVIYFWYGHV